MQKILSFLLIATLCTICAFADLAYEPRKNYKYDYFFSVQQAAKSSSALSSDEKVTIDLKATVEFYCVKRVNADIIFQLRIPDVELAGKDLNVDRKAAADYKRILGHYVAGFTLNSESGLITEFTHSSSDPEWSLNIKRGLLSVLQQNTKPDEFYTVKEFDTMGDLETDYTVEKTEEFIIYNRVKVSDNDGVISVFRSSNYVSTGRRIVEKVEFSDDHTMPWADDVNINANGHGSLIFHSEESFSGLPEVDQDMVPGTLALGSDSDEFVDDFSIAGVDIIPLIDLAEQYALEPSNGRLFSKIVSTLSLGRQYVYAVKPHLANEHIKNVLIDALVSTGRDDAIEVALSAVSAFDNIENDFVASSEIDEDAVVRVIMGSAYTNPSTSRMVDFNLKQMRSNNIGRRIRGAAALALGNLLFVAGENSVSRTRYLKNALNALEDGLKKSVDDDDKILYLYALGNAGQSSSASLIISKAFGEILTVRKAAVYGLRRMSSLNGIHEELIKVTINDVNSELQFSAFRSLFKEITLEEAKIVLNGLNEKSSEILINAIEMFKDSKLNQSLRPTIDGLAAKRPPLYFREGEFFLVGNSGVGAAVGYEVVVNNPLLYDGQDSVLTNLAAYGNVYALKKKLPVFDGIARLQGDLITTGTGDRPVEAYIYYSIGGSVWSECINLLGQGCSKIGGDQIVTKDDRNCAEGGKKLIDLSSTLFKQVISVPLPYGLSIKFGTNVAGYLRLDASASFCQRPYVGSANLAPKFGLDVTGETVIDAILIRAGVSIDAQVLHTNVTAKASLNFEAQPKQICAHVHVDQNAVKADFEFFAQIRDDLKFCGKIPCGLGWGHGLFKTVEMPGFKKGKFERDVHQSCVGWNRSRFNRGLFLQQ